MISLEKLRTEWRKQGYTDSQIATEVLKVKPATLSRKLIGDRGQEITATQFHALCKELGKPMDMFYVKM